MSYTKQFIDELTEEGKNPLEITDEQYDAEYLDYLRSLERETIAFRGDESFNLTKDSTITEIANEGEKGTAFKN